MSELITQQGLEDAGWKCIQWNPNWNGGYKEYHELIEDAGSTELRLSVRFDKRPDYGRDYMVFLVAWGSAISSFPLRSITTMDQLGYLIDLLHGAEIWPAHEIDGKTGAVWRVIYAGSDWEVREMDVLAKSAEEAERIVKAAEEGYGHKIHEIAHTYALSLSVVLPVLAN